MSFSLLPPSVQFFQLQLIYALPGLANGRRGPIKRTSVTETVVSKASKLSAYYCNDMTNLLDIDDSRTISNPNSHYGAGEFRSFFLQLVSYWLLL